MVHMTAAFMSTGMDVAASPMAHAHLPLLRPHLSQFFERPGAQVVDRVAEVKYFNQ